MKKHNNILFLLVFIFSFETVYSKGLLEDVKKETFVYSTKDTNVLKLDVYSINVDKQKQPCILFVFGGGFKQGVRDKLGYMDYFDYFVHKGFTVISIDYRLGLKGINGLAVTNYKRLKNAVDIAVEDLQDATLFVLSNADELNIDTSKIILNGSSAGAITCLQTDYTHVNKIKNKDKLPSNFNYAGVISFSGGIFSEEGKPKWKGAKASPTLFFHGQKDKIVPYNKLKLFKVGMFGSKYIVNEFDNNNFTYYFLSFKGVGHEVGGIAMREYRDEILQFIDMCVVRKIAVQTETEIKILRKEDMRDDD